MNFAAVAFSLLELGVITAIAVRQIRGARRRSCALRQGIWPYPRARAKYSLSLAVWGTAAFFFGFLAFSAWGLESGETLTVGSVLGLLVVSMVVGVVAFLGSLWQLWSGERCWRWAQSRQAHRLSRSKDTEAPPSDSGCQHEQR